MLFRSDTELAKKSDDNHTHSDYASNTHNHDTSYSQLNHTHNYATETYVTNAIANAALGGDVNLDGYATETYVDTQLSTKSDSTHNHDGSYATTTHTHTGYATESYVTDLETSVDTEISQLKSTMDDFVRNKIEDILNRLMLLEKSLSVNVLSTKYLNSNWKFNIVSSTSS